MNGFHEHAQIHGGKIVANVLRTAELYEKWQAEIKDIYENFAEIRARLVEKLKTLPADSN
jgi:aspartate/tyrosine/aromatic aminotransferase